jgi:hypothetical protein
MKKAAAIETQKNLAMVVDALMMKMILLRKILLKKLQKV